MTSQIAPYNESIWYCEDYGDYIRLRDTKSNRWQAINKKSDLFFLIEIRKEYIFKIGKYEFIIRSFK